MNSHSSTLRTIPRLALALPPRLRRYAILTALLAAALTTLYFTWLRDSSLVQVQTVTVVGLTGPDAPRLRTRLEEAGKGMTTLHVREAALRKAVATEPSILAIRAVPDFPHGLRIDVLENHPVAAVDLPGSGRVPIAGNGTLMPGYRSAASVPAIRLQGAPRIGRDSASPARLADERAAQLVRVAAAAPPALLGRATTIERRAGEGIVVTLQSGPRVIFGDATQLPEKWRAAAGVLASKDASGAAYVDVRLPDRPVAGGLNSPISASTGLAAATTGVPAATPTAPAGVPATTTVTPAASTPQPSTLGGGSVPGTATSLPASPATTQSGGASATAGAPTTNTQP
ncbi:MAG: cell division protein FtsQ [Thermoleophilales bacterium]|nr:cell division protein FtsQ [Thermoleophilales bacterium]